MSEVSSATLRQILCAIVMLSWAIGEILLPIVAYYVTDWRMVFVYLALIPTLIVIVLVFLIVHESPRFLLNHKLINQCKIVLLRTARINSTLDQSNYVHTFISQQDRINN